MNGPAAFLAEAAAIVGAAHVHGGRDDLSGYDVDGRGHAGDAFAIVRPSCTAAVSALVRAARAAEVTLVPQGGRTGLVAAGVGDTTGRSCLLSLDRMRGPPRIDSVNRTALVDAGVLLSGLNAAAGAYGLIFPIDLGADPSIGGMVAANTGGARFLRYGDVRRNLLSLEVVLNDTDGTVLTLGRHVWKDNSGLDLKQLFVGASGSLGIVTQATVALQPKPATAVTALLALSDPDHALSLLVALEAHFGGLLTAFEGMSTAAMQAAINHVPHLRLPFAGGLPSYAVLIELSAGAAFTPNLLVTALGELLGDDLATGRVDDVVIDQGGGLWMIRHAIPEGLRAAGRVIACDVALPRGSVMRFRREVTSQMAAALPALVPHDFGHIGDGGLHFNMVWPAALGALDPAIADRARDIVFAAAVDDYGGSFSAEHGIGPSNLRYYRRYVPGETRRLAGAVQRLAAPTPIGRVDFAGLETQEMML